MLQWSRFKHHISSNMKMFRILVNGNNRIMFIAQLLCWKLGLWLTAFYRQNSPGETSHFPAKAPKLRGLRYLSPHWREQQNLSLNLGHWEPTCSLSYPISLALENSICEVPACVFASKRVVGNNSTVTPTRDFSWNDPLAAVNKTESTAGCLKSAEQTQSQLQTSGFFSVSLNITHT